jgi:hypothetical protein
MHSDVRMRSTTPRMSTRRTVRLSATATGGQRGRLPSDRRKGWPSGGRWGHPPRLSNGGRQLSRLPEVVRNRRPPLPSIWGRLPVPSALYDSNFSFLDYVFASLIAVT